MRGEKQMREEKLIVNSEKNIYVGAGPVSAQINKTNTNNIRETIKNSTKWGIPKRNNVNSPNNYNNNSFNPSRSNNKRNHRRKWNI